MHPILKNLQKQVEENPLLAAGVGSSVVAVVTGLVNSIVSARNSRTWNKEVARRTMRDGVRKSK